MTRCRNCKRKQQPQSVGVAVAVAVAAEVAAALCGHLRFLGPSKPAAQFGITFALLSSDD
jgi:hypothetical protein